MKNTTIPITATIVFSAAVAVLNVVQNEPSRLHANGFQTLGTCWSRETDTKSNCLPAGLHGEVEYGRKKDPKNLSEGAEAWDCGLQIMNEKAKAVDIGRAMYTVAEPLCRVNQLWRVTTKDGKKVWEEVGPVELLRSELCGKYMRIDLSYVDCDERG